jgi:hypothetical protein
MNSYQSLFGLIGFVVVVGLILVAVARGRKKK